MTYLVLDESITDLNDDLEQESLPNSEIINKNQLKLKDEIVENNSNIKRNNNISNMILEQQELLNQRLNIAKNDQLNLRLNKILDKINGLNQNSILEQDLAKTSKKEEQDNLKEEDSNDEIIIQIIEDNKEEQQGDSTDKQDDSELLEDNSDITRDSTTQGLKDVSEDEKIEEKIFLSIKDGYVAIYKGNSLANKELQEIRKDISVNKLSEDDKKKLLEGIEIETEEELLSILEGFLGAVNE